MVKIKCRAIDCIFWDVGFCSADAITYDPEEGCLTYEVIDDLLDEDDWDDEDIDDLVVDDGKLGYPYDDDDDDLDDGLGDDILSGDNDDW